MSKTPSEQASPFTVSVRPLLIVISGPSGVGKDALLNRMKQPESPLEYVVTVTTRPRRHTEIEGVDYHFVTRHKFESMIANGELLEWANVYDNWYGVPKAAVREALGRGRDVIVKVDIQGAATIKQIAPQAVFIFLVPPSLEELIVRLKQRHTESPDNLTLRIEKATDEMKKTPLFDYVVVNERDKLDYAVDKIKAIITAEKCRVRPGKSSCNATDIMQI
jgi:guanylate kinase